MQLSFPTAPFFLFDSHTVDYQKAFAACKIMGGGIRFMDIEIGDNVILKGGGPIMVVDEIIDADRVVCLYFVGKDLKSKSFNIKTLERVKEKENE